MSEKTLSNGKIRPTKRIISSNSFNTSDNYRSACEKIRFEFKFTINNFLFQKFCDPIFKCSTEKFKRKEIPNYQWMLEVVNDCSPGSFKSLQVRLYVYQECGQEMVQLPSPCSVKITIPNLFEPKVGKPFKSQCYLPMTCDLQIQPAKYEEKMNEIASDGNLSIWCEVELLTPRIFLSSQFMKPTISATACSTKFIERLDDLFENKKMCDITFIVDGTKLHAHKIVLAAKSPVFEAMFTHETQEKLLNRVDVVDILPEVFKEILRFVYTGKIESTLMKEFCIKLLIAADKYMLDDLKMLCLNYLHSSLSPENALDVLAVAHRYSFEDIYSNTLHYLRFHATEVIKTESWKKAKETSPSWLCDIVEFFAGTPTSSVA